MRSGDLQKITVKVHGKEKGTGILYPAPNDKHVYLLTARHTVDGRDALGTDQKHNINDIKIFLFNKSSCKTDIEYDIPPIEIIRSKNFKKDIIIITLDKQKIKQILKILDYETKNHKELKQGNNIIFGGFPRAAGEDFDTDDTGTYKEIEMKDSFQFDTTKDYSNREKEEDDGVGATTHKYFVSGYSGAGVFFNDSNTLSLIGILTKYRESGKTCYAIPIQQFFELVDIDIMKRQSIAKNQIKLKSDLGSDIIFKRSVSKRESYSSYTDMFMNNIEDTTLLDVVKQEQYIVLLGDAGLGKSEELKMLTNALSQENELSFYVELKRKSNLDIGELSSNIGMFYLILDGLDEVDSLEIIKEEIDRYILHYPNAKIIISCRKSFFKLNTTLSKEFNPYYILPLSRDEINRYIESKLSPRLASNFRKQLSNQLDTYELLTIPFFLVRLVEYFKGNKTFPTVGELFKFLIDTALQSRLKSQTQNDENHQLRVKCVNNLTKMAFIMEVMGVNSLAHADYLEIIDTEIMKVLNPQSSLLTQNNEDWQFTHRNFQEYLAAQFLSKCTGLSEIQSVICFKENRNEINPAWQHVMAFLTNLLTGQLQKEWINWILEVAPFYLFQSEVGNLDKALKTEIIYQIFEKLELKETSIHWGYMPNFTRFIEKSADLDEIMKFILSKLAKFPECYFPILSYIDKSVLKDYWEDIYPLIEVKLESEYNDFCFTLLAKSAEFVSEENYTKWIDKYIENPEVEIRKSCYLLIRAKELQYKYMDFLIVRCLNEEGNGNTDPYDIVNCLEKSNQTGIISFFEVFMTRFQEIDNNGKHTINDIVRIMIKNAVNNTFIQVISPMQRELISNSLVKIVFSNSLCFDNQKEILSFFQQTQRLYVLINAIINKPTSYWHLNYYLNEQGIKYLVEEYQNKNITQELLLDLYNNVYGENASYFRKHYQELLGMPLPSLSRSEKGQNEYQFSQEKQKELTYQATFYKEAFIAQLSAIFEMGEMEVFGENLHKALSAKNFYNNTKFSTQIYWYIYRNCSTISKEELEKHVEKNWEKQLQPDLAYTYLKDKQGVVIQDAEKNILKAWCKNIYTEKFKAEYAIKVHENGEIRYYNHPLWFYYFVSYFNFIDYDKNVYKSFFEYMLWFHTDLIYGFLQKQLSPQEINELVVEQIKSLKWMNSSTFFFYIKSFIKNLPNTEGIDADIFKPYFGSENKEVKKDAISLFISLDGEENDIIDLLQHIEVEDIDVGLLILGSLENKGVWGRKPVKDFINKHFNNHNIDRHSKHLLVRYMFLINEPSIFNYFKQCIEMGDWELIDNTWSIIKEDSFVNMKLLTHLDNILSLYIAYIEKRNPEHLSNIFRMMLHYIAIHDQGHYYYEVKAAIDANINLEINGIKDERLKSFSDNLAYTYHRIKKYSIEEAIAFYEKYKK